MAHPTPASSSNMEHTKGSLASPYGCPSSLSKFLLQTFGCRKLKDGKFPKSITGNETIKETFDGSWFLTCSNFPSVNNKMNRKKRAYNWNHHTDDFVNGVGGDRSACRARYQQSSVDVFAKFVAIDQVN